MLGPIEALVEGRPAGLTAGKQRALLAALLIDAGRTVPVDVLIDRLWGERPPPTAVKNVQVLVSQLRRLLGADAITTDGSGYRLRDEAADVTTFTALLESGRAELAAGDAREAERTLDEALALWRRGEELHRACLEPRHELVELALQLLERPLRAHGRTSSTRAPNPPRASVTSTTSPAATAPASRRTPPPSRTIA